MSVKLRKRSNKDGTITPYLDIYHEGKRTTKFLTELKLVKTSSPVDRKMNSDNLAIAKKIAIKTAQELESNNYQVALLKDKVDFLQYLDSYIDNYSKKDKRNMSGAVNKFKLYLKDEGIKIITSKHVNETLVLGYKEYLERVSTGEGAASYFARFKKILKQGVRDKIYATNPAADVTIKKGESHVKDVLTSDEIKLLANAKCPNDDVKRAFLFSCFTGLRFVDVNALTWQSIDLKNETFTVNQSKTNRRIVGKLHKSAVELLGQPAGKNELVFTLPSHTACLKDLKKWCTNAEVDKHITWHSARHTFGTLLVYYGTDINTASQLLGHQSLKYIQRYSRSVKEMKDKAIDNLPGI